ncbi:Outer membrane protein assembly factor BamA [subsurface metagenome]
MGLGFLPVHGGNVEIELNREWIATNLNIGADTPYFPQFSAQLNKFSASFNLDQLDDVLLPRRGYRLRGFYKISSPEFGSDLDYWRANLEASYYFQVNRLVTLKIGASFVRSSSSMPIYKYYYYGGPGSYIGTEYNQLVVDRMTILRVAYRYRYSQQTYLKLVWHTVFDYNFHFADATLGIDANLQCERMQAVGVGILYMAPFGPVEITISQGRESALRPSSHKNYLYFSAGYKF